MLRNELLRLVGLHKPSTSTYVLDDIATEKGHNVIGLPPYCQYNPIEVIWDQVKGYAARHNTTPPFTANRMLQLLKTAVDNVSAEHWKKVVIKCRKLMEEDWERDVRFDNICEQEFIINLQDCSSDSEIKQVIAIEDNKKIKSRPRQPNVANLDSFDLSAIHNKINEFYCVKKQVPTLRSLLADLRESIGFTGCHETLRLLLFKNGFE
ncbi:hypothetical protein HF086_003055 [Spodoptera exigua]|uniref:Tc1-like transposase DDE domain-containing protein n=1 Tax=Spodoptera exigua TaxID=7107 RepID=A0A922SKC0_SPOEX|nr:hypothetical protein HF086_003055 [Spodoptera exigua]